MLDKASVLTDLKVILATDEDDVLNVLINKAERDIKAYCNNPFLVDKDGDGKAETYDFPEDLIGALEDLVGFMYGKRGSEGKASESMGSMSFNYEADIPAPIKRRLYRFRLMKFN